MTIRAILLGVLAGVLIGFTIGAGYTAWATGILS